MNGHKTITALSRDQIKYFYLITAGFALVLGVSILKGMLFVAGLPVVFMIGLIMIFRLDLIAFFSVIITPFSINLAHTNVGIGVSLPSEPLMFGLFLLFWLKVFEEGGLNKRILYHPVSIIIYVHMAWYLLTTLTSSMWIVSFKATLARFCYISVYYFMFIYLFSKKDNLRRFVWSYTVPLLIVIAYTITVHALGGFSEEVAHTAMVPFYNDHTAYAAVISFFIPVFFGFTFDKSMAVKYRWMAGIVLLILLIAVILSYTRAAWVGLVAAFCCYLALVMRMKSVLIYGGFAMLIVLAFLFRTQITMKLESNNEVSSDDYASHVQSIGNISSDDSNIERLNRWACALRMFADRPVFGYGPGTYMFKYGAYQKYSERSGISTNFAEGGGSHSEYLGPLSEQGVLGPLIVIALIIVTTQTTATYMKRTKRHENKILARGILLGLVTYWVHGVLNFFLDTEKASVPYWGFIAILVALQIYDTSGSGEQADTEQGNII